MKLQAKKVRAALLLVLCVLFTSCGAREAGGAALCAHEGIIRLHVIASSNEDYDQELKLKVRDKVLEVINKNLIHETMMKYDEEMKEATLTIDESREYIKNNLAEIEKIAESVIKENGYDYAAKANLGICFIPEKKYGGVTFPAGNYEALNIAIGEGAGENWWCVLFPPLCLIDAQGKGEKEIEMDGVNVKLGADMNRTRGAIKLKFKTLEVVDSLKTKKPNNKTINNCT